MKDSIARKVTRRVSLILIIAMAVLLIGSFLIAANVVYNNNVHYSRAVLSMFYDLLLYASDEPFPVDMEHTDRIAYYGKYISTWYLVDFAYVYVPDKETGERTYLSFSASNEDLEEGMTGHKFVREPRKEELEIWNNETIITSFVGKTEFGRELSTIILLNDTFGNSAIVGVDYSIDAVYAQIFRLYILIALSIILIIVAIDIFVYMVLRKNVSEPAKKLSRSMQDYIAGGEQSSVKMEAKGPAEYRMIAEAFNCMTDNIKTYTENIGALTRKQERQQTELEIAARIQKGFLPPETFASSSIDIHATMRPAKDVGGDLYDYVRLDDHRILTVVADVSGKGVTAAIFMSVTLTLIRQFAKMDLTPDEILRRTNDALAENNPAMLFVTAFVGIYDSEAKTFTYSNAGHNIPYIVGGTLRTLDKSRGTLLGLFKGEEYSSSTEDMCVGDTVFLYTDGVNEATDRDDRFYGTDRLEEKLLEYAEDKYGSEDLVTYIGRSLYEFSSGAEQHDDITMLAMEMKDTAELLDFDVRELERIKEKIFSLPIGREDQFSLYLAAEECFVNIVSYAFPDGAPEGEKVRFSVTVSDKIKLCFEDGGQPFDPLAEIENPEDYDIETQIGGLGKFLAFSNVDDAKYDYSENKNILTLIKYFEEDNK